MPKKITFHCDICHKDLEYSDITSTGFGKTKTGQTACYSCCKRLDIDNMLLNKKAILYLCFDDNNHITVENWPGTLKLPVLGYKKGRHNIARIRHDVWFDLYNTRWHGVTYGDNTQLCHCKQILA